MNHYYLSLACHSCIVASFIIKLVNKFKMSFRAQTSSNEIDTYTVAYFSRPGGASESLIIGSGELKTFVARSALCRLCRDVAWSRGYSFSHIATWNHIAGADDLGNVNLIEFSKIVDKADRMRIVGKYYELLGQEQNE